MCDRQEELRSAIKDPVCLAANDALAACMAASGRDWTKCQAQVKLLRACQQTQAAAAAVASSPSTADSGAGKAGPKSS